MARKSSNEYPEMPMDIVAGNIAHLMQRKHMSNEELSKVLGYNQVRTLENRMKDPARFTGADLNHICIIFGVTMEQLSHDCMS